MRGRCAGISPARRWCMVLLLAAFAAGCADPVTDANESFERCMESAGFALQGSSGGISNDGIGVDYVLAEPRLAVPAERVARACVESVSFQIGRVVFLESD